MKENLLWKLLMKRYGVLICIKRKVIQGGRVLKDFLSITDMADLHNVSRQTLIYYDKIGLFKPDHIDENGYRYYSPLQIPFLREICFLKTIGIKLDDIKKHIEHRDINNAISLLEYHKKFLDKEISNLLKTRKFIQQRLDIYSDANRCNNKLHKPFLKEYSERKVVFVPFENVICRQELHITLMKAWNILIKHGMLPSEGFGTMFINKSLQEHDIFKSAGIVVHLPIEDEDIHNVLSIPAGEYACMYKYAMPYETKYLYDLVEWIEDNNYKIVGNIIDECLLDTTFYGSDKKVDFCLLKIPIEKIK